MLNAKQSVAAMRRARKSKKLCEPAIGASVGIGRHVEGRAEELRLVFPAILSKERPGLPAFGHFLDPKHQFPPGRVAGSEIGSLRAPASMREADEGAVLVCFQLEDDVRAMAGALIVI